MGLVLGVLAGIFVLGVITKKATSMGAYAGFFTSAIIVISLKYNHPEVTSCIIGYIISLIHLGIKKQKSENC